MRKYKMPVLLTNEPNPTAKLTLPTNENRTRTSGKKPGFTKKLRIRYKHLLLDPVNIKKDLYGFVYAPARNSRGLYNPFPNASAYHQ
jgi:hypothetical protein